MIELSYTIKPTFAYVFELPLFQKRDIRHEKKEVEDKCICTLAHLAPNHFQAEERGQIKVPKFV